MDVDRVVVVLLETEVGNGVGVHGVDLLEQRQELGIIEGDEVRDRSRLRWASRPVPLAGGLGLDGCRDARRDEKGEDESVGSSWLPPGGARGALLPSVGDRSQALAAAALRLRDRRALAQSGVVALADAVAESLSCSDPDVVAVDARRR